MAGQTESPEGRSTWAQPGKDKSICGAIGFRKGKHFFRSRQN